MKEHNSQLGQLGLQFTAEERHHYRRPKTLRLIFDLSLPWVQAILGCTLFIAYPFFWSWLVAIVIIAGAQHGLSLIAHEGSHLLIRPQNKRMNDLIAAYLFAAPTLLPFNVYRQRHVIHHRLVSQAGDTKNVYRRDWRGWRFFAEVIRSLSGLDYLLKARDALHAGKSDVYEQFDANLRRDQRSILIVHAIIFLVFTLFDPFYYGIPTYYFILWLWPLITVSFLFAKIRALIEHQPPRTEVSETPEPQETLYFMNTPGPMLRSVKATWIERLYLSKINFHYHAEHHLWPWISYQYLPEMNSRIWQGHEHENTLLLNGNLVVLDDSYSTVIKNVILAK